jgi:trehalose synthase
VTTLLDQYEGVVGSDNIDQLRQLAKLLEGRRVLNVNSTKAGGGVAEILHRMVPLMRELGIDARWETISGDDQFFQCTKLMHNTLQGKRMDISPALLKHYEIINRENFAMLRENLEAADIVFIHDPQPAAMIDCMPVRTGKWIWRCHIDVGHPYRPVWRFLRKYVQSYDASIWSLSEFAQRLPHPMYLMAPSIDPLSDKNCELSREDLEKTYERWGLDPFRPIITQISRFDRFKDPLGVIHTYRLVKEFVPIQLVLAGGGATDDPEGAEVLSEVMSSAGDDADVHILNLPPDDNLTVNALQRVSDIVLQKSLREGFGLTVSEAMWKAKPVIGGDTGGIRLQVVDYHTGFLVNTPEGAALRIRYLLKRRDILRNMGDTAREFVRENFLITRNLREYLTLMVAIMYGANDRIELL